MTYGKKSEWVPIDSLNGWLYLLAEPLSVGLKCPNQTKILIDLDEIGIIQVSPGCQLQMQDTTFYGSTSKIGSMAVIYEPILHLNLADLSPLLKEHGDPTMKGEEKNQHSGDAPVKRETFATNEKSLDELEQRLSEMSL